MVSLTRLVIQVLRNQVAMMKRLRPKKGVAQSDPHDVVLEDLIAATQALIEEVTKGAAE